MLSLQYCRDVFGMTGNAADTCVKSDFRSKTDLDVGHSEVTRMSGPRKGSISSITFVVESTRKQIGNSNGHPSSVLLGSASLAKLLERHRGDLELYHSGDCDAHFVQIGNIRTLIRVI